MNTIQAPIARRRYKSAGGAADQTKADQTKADATKAEPKAADVAQDNAIGLDQLTKAIGEMFKKEMSQHIATLPTEAKIAELIEAKLKAANVDSKAITKDNAKDIVTDIVGEAFKAVSDVQRKEKANVRNAADASGGDAAAARQKSSDLDIDMPISWCKGNLPLHGKQLLNIMLGESMNKGIDDAMIQKGKTLGDRQLSYLNAQAKSLQMRGKAMTSTGAGTGDEFVPTDLSANLLTRFFLGSPLAAVFMADEIAMPTDPYVFPLSTTRPSFLWESTENTNFTASDPGTANTTLQTVRMAGEVDYSDELDEDSIIAILPMVQQRLAEGAIDAWENALINGDTTGTHQDSDTAAGSAKLPAKAVKGFRKLALAISSLKSDMSSGGIGTNANFLALRKLMKKYGGNPKNLIWVCSPTAAITMQGIAETVSLEKFGSRATIITGELAALQGIPIIQSEQVREDVNASGVYDGTTTTKSTVLCINKTRFLTGFRRQFRIEKDKLIQSGKNLVVASFRKAFTPIEVPSATITSVAIGYNFAP